MNRLLFSILMVVLISGCASKSTEIPKPDINAIGTQIAATMIASGVQTQQAKPTPTIYLTPTVTPTPTQTPMPTPTINPLYTDKQPGIYLVNVDIAPGIWRSLENGDMCYWFIKNKKGESIKQFIGMAGGTIYIAPTAFQVELAKECGSWKFLEKP